MAMAAGTPDRDPRRVRHLHRSRTPASTLAGWFSFQPLWDEICRTDPELFE